MDLVSEYDFKILLPDSEDRSIMKNKQSGGVCCWRIDSYLDERGHYGLQK